MAPRPKRTLAEDPELLAQWDLDRNDHPNPGELSVISGLRVWWVCPTDPAHSWQVAVQHRGGPSRSGCPYCSGRLAGAGTGLDSTHPDLAAQWHPTLNGDFTPAKARPGSMRSVWWLCPKGPDHQWRADIGARALNGAGCPVCLGRVVVPSTSVTQARPDLAAQWHPTLNGDLTPDTLTPGRSVDIVWQCPVTPAHVWTAQLRRRNLGHSNCPHCPKAAKSRRQALAVERPDLAAQWHPTLNGDLTPQVVTAASGRQVRWVCPTNDKHQWAATVSSRTSSGSGCPFCAGKQVLAAESLGALNPDLAAQWHPTGNGDLTPFDVAPRSSRQVRWVCPDGPDHQWRASVVKRADGGGCPHCGGSKTARDRSLGVLHPDLAAQWHPTGNGPLTPFDVLPGSTKQHITWQCPDILEHTWAAVPFRRVEGGGCPYCAGVRVTPERTLAAAFPEVAAQWHPERNGTLTAADVAGRTSLKVWWQCPRDEAHEWAATIANRTLLANGCPQCQIRPRSKAEVSLAAELAAFVTFDRDDHKVDLEGWSRPADCDILLRTLKVVVEYDGSYWHATASGKDQYKTTGLARAGWTVIRVREKPLLPVPGALCVTIRPSDVKTAAVGVLRHLADLGHTDRNRVEAYAARPGLGAAAVAQQWIGELIAATSAAI